MSFCSEITIALAKSFDSCEDATLGRNLKDAAFALGQARDAEHCQRFLPQALQNVLAGLRSSTSPTELHTLRCLYTDICILNAVANSLLSQNIEAISSLDNAIIVAGPSGKGRAEAVQSMIKELQQLIKQEQVSILPRISNFATNPTNEPPCSIPCLPSPPTMRAFQLHHSQGPFILRGFASSWPAMQEHPWDSTFYLRSVAGPGRTVPVEVGRDYRDDNWTQKFMNWDDFLGYLESSHQRSRDDPNNEILYLAQHDLTRQFPELSEDFVIPDYVFASLSPEYASYEPPPNRDQLIVNMWFGPRGTISPAHIDPFHNIYVQVVGQKEVWLAPPSVSEYMQAGHESDRDKRGTLSNTSQMDVFNPREGRHETFQRNVSPSSMIAMLNPGDLLFFPPGWWHALRSHSTSFSLSMWF